MEMGTRGHVPCLPRHSAATLVRRRGLARTRRPLLSTWPRLLKQDACSWQPLTVVSRTCVFGSVHVAISIAGAMYLLLSAPLCVFTLELLGQPSRSPPTPAPRIMKLDHRSALCIRNKASQARGQRPRCPEGLGGNFGTFVPSPFHQARVH